jgi:hypothetical protein
MKAIVCVLVMLTLLFACGKDNSTNPGPTTQIMPLKIGNSWTFSRATFDANGHTVIIDTLTETIVRDTIINNERWYIALLSSGDSSRTDLMTNRADGLWGRRYDEAFIAINYPMAVGDTLGDDGLFMTLESDTTSITVPAGDFSCYNYHLFGSNIDIYNYYSPGIGQIMLRIFDVEYNPYLKNKAELLSYHLE